MKRFLYTLALAVAALSGAGTAFAGELQSDALLVKECRIPVLLEREDNVVLMMKLIPETLTSLDDITIEFGEGSAVRSIKSVKLYYGGTDARTYARDWAYGPVEYISAFEAGKTRKANPSHSVLLDKGRPAAAKDGTASITLSASRKLFPGVNYFWVSVEMKHRSARLGDCFTVAGVQARSEGKPLPVEIVSERGFVHRMGIGVRHAGDDGAAAYRIPGLVTSRKGTLVATYDIRYNSARDLQDYIDVGVSRSTDGGRHWKRMQKAIAMGTRGGLPLSQNGAGDAAILSDDTTGKLFIVSIWAHGMGHQVSWWSTVPGMDPEYTAQLVLVESSDDGRTWSEPVSITPQMKDSAWAFFFDGPGRGICTSDGKLVFASQYTDFDNGRTPHAGIFYSEDHGKTWHIHSPAKDQTTESQVAELPDGSLMLNMRDNRGGSRSVAVTRDMGRTWEEHPSSRSALREPVCMASLISVRASENVSGKNLLLFSNPDNTSARNRITIKVSLDDGLTWSNGLLLDEDSGWGYSCLTMIDPETVGILYESSVANITFQAIPLRDIMEAR